MKMMNKLNRITFFVIAIVFFANFAQAQELLVKINYNPVIKNYIKTHKHIPLKDLQSADTLELPFFDDFAKPTIYPDSSRWLDNNVFINTGYAFKPNSVGVATFDMIDSIGDFYSNASPDPFVGDILTSKPINLEPYADTTVYLSFMYQPKGKGSSPETTDSLILEFIAPGMSGWHVVWKTSDVEIIDSVGPVFVDTLIRVYAEYLKKGFQFRFLNIASLSSNPDPSFYSNNDQWNIDYVYLNQRPITDTLFDDIAFVQPIGSLLKNYESIPWSHFISPADTLMKDSMLVDFQNNGLNDQWNVTPQFQITDKYVAASPFNFTGGSVDLDTLEKHQYNQAIESTSGAHYTFNSTSVDSALFQITSYLKTDTITNPIMRYNLRWNDTLVYYQKFDNYYAYDDGTAESGYVLSGANSNTAMLAYQFNSYKKDTLRAIQIYFNQLANTDQTANYFNLKVWADNEGIPGSIIYEKKTPVQPIYNELNQFCSYKLDSTFTVEGKFYIGWQKTQDHNKMNIGFDNNNIANDKLFYNVTGSWQHSIIEGALMVRPVFGKAIGGIGIEEITALSSIVYPNPASSVLNVSLPIDNLSKVQGIVYDLSGKVLKSISDMSQPIDISDLPNGYYLLKMQNGNQAIQCL